MDDGTPCGKIRLCDAGLCGFGGKCFSCHFGEGKHDGVSAACVSLGTRLIGSVHEAWCDVVVPSPWHTVLV